VRQAIRSTRPGGHVSYVSIPTASSCPAKSCASLHSGPAPVRRLLPELIDLIWNRAIKPGKVFDLNLPLD
jgi:threonine dehydrogenase-like Zn-dependent dehydrogenase